MRRGRRTRARCGRGAEGQPAGRPACRHTGGPQPQSPWAQQPG